MNIESEILKKIEDLLNVKSIVKRNKLILQLHTHLISNDLIEENFKIIRIAPNTIPIIVTRNVNQALTSYIYYRLINAMISSSFLIRDNALYSFSFLTDAMMQDKLITPESIKQITLNALNILNYEIVSIEKQNLHKIAIVYILRTIKELNFFETTECIEIITKSKLVNYLFDMITTNSYKICIYLSQSLIDLISYIADKKTNSRISKIPCLNFDQSSKNTAGAIIPTIEKYIKNLVSLSSKYGSHKNDFNNCSELLVQGSTILSFMLLLNAPDRIRSIISRINKEKFLRNFLKVILTNTNHKNVHLKEHLALLAITSVAISQLYKINLVVAILEEINFLLSSNIIPTYRLVYIAIELLLYYKLIAISPNNIYGTNYIIDQISDFDYSEIINHFITSKTCNELFRQFLNYVNSSDILALYALNLFKLLHFGYTNHSLYQLSNSISDLNETNKEYHNIVGANCHYLFMVNYIAQSNSYNLDGIINDLFTDQGYVDKTTFIHKLTDLNVQQWVLEFFFNETKTEEKMDPEKFKYSLINTMNLNKCCSYLKSIVVHKNKHDLKQIFDSFNIDNEINIIDLSNINKNSINKEYINFLKYSAKLGCILINKLLDEKFCNVKKNLVNELIDNLIASFQAVVDLIENINYINIKTTLIDASKLNLQLPIVTASAILNQNQDWIDTVKFLKQHFSFLLSYQQCVLNEFLFELAKQCEVNDLQHWWNIVTGKLDNLDIIGEDDEDETDESIVTAELDNSDTKSTIGSERNNLESMSNISMCMLNSTPRQLSTNSTNNSINASNDESVSDNLNYQNNAEFYTTIENDIEINDMSELLAHIDMSEEQQELFTSKKAEMIQLKNLSITDDTNNIEYAMAYCSKKIQACKLIQHFIGIFASSLREIETQANIVTTYFRFFNYTIDLIIYFSNIYRNKYNSQAVTTIYNSFTKRLEELIKDCNKIINCVVEVIIINKTKIVTTDDQLTQLFTAFAILCDSIINSLANIARNSEKRLWMHIFKFIKSFSKLIDIYLNKKNYTVSAATNNVAIDGDRTDDMSKFWVTKLLMIKFHPFFIRCKKCAASKKFKSTPFCYKVSTEQYFCYLVVNTICNDKKATLTSILEAIKENDIKVNDTIIFAHIVTNLKSYSLNIQELYYHYHNKYIKHG